MKLNRESILALERFTKQTIIERFKADEKCVAVMLSVLHREKLIYIADYNNELKPVFIVGDQPDVKKPTVPPMTAIKWAQTAVEIDEQLEQLLEAETRRYEIYCFRLRTNAQRAKHKLAPDKSKPLDMSLIAQLERINHDHSL